MYDQFLANPSAVDSSWHDFFADYQPAAPGENSVAPRTDSPAPSVPPLAGSATATKQTVSPTTMPLDLEQDTTTPLRGAAARVVANMETSLELPTATIVNE